MSTASAVWQPAVRVTSDAVTLIGSPQTLASPLLGGATQEVSVAWNVPFADQPHQVYAVVSQPSALRSRTQSNATNLTVSRWTVLPDIVIDVLPPGVESDLAYLWDTSGRNFTGLFQPIYAVAVPTSAVVVPLDPGVFQALLPPRGATVFYRVGLSP